MGFNAKQSWTSMESRGYDGIEIIFVEGSEHQDRMMILGEGEVTCLVEKRRRE